MSDRKTTRTVFIREGTPLPSMLSIESEAFLPGWRVVENLDRQALTREVEGANWTFFYLAGEMRATVFGREGRGALRRGVKRVLAKQEGQKFNSLELTKIVPRRFFGIPFISVTAHSRHIQRDICLVPAKDLVVRMPVATAPDSALGSGAERHHGKAGTKQYVGLISSS